MVGAFSGRRNFRTCPVWVTMARLPDAGSRVRRTQPAGNKRGSFTAMETLSKKICMLGDFAVGKTSLVRRFVHDVFDDRYISTIGVKVSRKPATVSSGDRVVDLTMILWDLAGSEEFSQMRSAYLRGAAGALLVYDLTRPETLTRLVDYASQVRQTTAEASFVVVANKSDLIPVSENGAQANAAALDGRALAASLGAPFLSASALTGFNVEEAFRQMAVQVVG